MPRRALGQPISIVAILVLLAIGVNVLVQKTGGSESPWQALYALLVGVVAVAFPPSILALTAGTVVTLEIAQAWSRLPGGALDLLRTTGLIVGTAGSLGFLMNNERRRTRRVEAELRRLNLEVERLGEDEDGEIAGALSEEGRRRSLVSHVRALDQHLSAMLELARRATRARASVLIEMEPEEEGFHVRASGGEADVLPPAEKVPLGSFLGEVIREERILCVSEPDRPLPALAWYRSQPVLHSFLAAPVVLGRRAGWVLAFDHEEAGRFGAIERELAQGFANQLGEWMKSTRFLAELDALSREFQGLYQASAELSTSRRVEEILKQVRRFCGDVGGFETCAICLVNEGEEEFSVPLAEGYPARIAGSRFPVQAFTWAGWMLRARDEPLAIRFERRSGMPILASGEKIARDVSFLAVPLVAKKNVRGALLLTRKGTGFSSNEVNVLRVLCNQAAVAIENAKVYERLEEMAATDGLTGLFNRRYFEEALAREVARAERGEKGLALLILDIDHFKDLNDTYGHTMGDLVLKQVAEILKGTLRRGDVLARFGGEEFVILLPAATARGVSGFAERARKAVATAPVHPGGGRKKVTVSGGWALFPEDAATEGALIESADRALYAAKEMGRNKIVSFESLASQVVSRSMR